MKTKPTLEQWKESANLLLLAERTLNDLFKHPVIRSSRSTRRDQLRRTMQSLSRLKSNLDSDICSAFHESGDSIVKVFYPLPGTNHETIKNDNEAWFFDEEETK